MHYPSFTKQYKKKVCPCKAAGAKAVHHEAGALVLLISDCVRCGC